MKLKSIYRVKYLLRVTALALLVYFSLNLKGCGDYDKEVKRLCKVCKHYNTDAGYKVSAKFILVLQVRDTNYRRPFHVDVSPSTYFECKDNEYWYFYVSEREIKPDPKKEMEDLMRFLTIVAAIILMFVSFIKFDED